MAAVRSLDSRDQARSPTCDYAAPARTFCTRWHPMNPQEMVAPVADDILAMADEAESERRLPDKLMAKLTDAGLFAIYTPRQFGGMGLALPDALGVVEEVAKYDGSVAWVVALGFANDLF